MTKLQYIKFSIYFLFFFNALKSQQINFKHFSNSDGLPSSCIYNSVQDSKGFMWFATDKGVARFDGSEFVNFDVSNGLANNSAYSLCLNHDTLLVGCVNGFSMLVNQSQVIALPVDSSQLFYNNTVIKQGNFLYSLSYENESIIYDLKNKKSIRDGLFIKYGLSCPYYLCKTNTNTILEARERGLYAYYNNIKKKKLDIKQLNNKKIQSIVCSNFGLLTVSTNQAIYFLKNYIVSDSIVLPVALQNLNLKVYRTKNDILWLFGKEGQFFKVENLHNQYVFSDYSKIFFPRIVSINSVLEDVNGNVWVTTYNNGLYCIYNSFSQHYTDDDGLNGAFLNDIIVDKEQNIYAAANSGIYIKPKNNKFNKVADFKDYCYKIVPNGSKLMACIVLGKPLKSKSVALNFLQNQTFDSLCFIRASRLSIHLPLTSYAKWGNFVMFRDTITGLEKKVIITKRKIRIYKIYTQNGIDYWIGTTNGLYYINYVTGNIHKIAIVKSKVSDIIMSKKHNLLVATEKALYVLRKQKWTEVTEYQNKKINNITAFAIDNKNRVWAATNKGLFISNDSNYFYQIAGYPNLLTNEINCLTFDSLTNSMYAGSNLGITVVDINKMDKLNNSPPKVQLLQIKAADTIIVNPKNIILSPYQTNISLHYTAIEFSIPQNLAFRYKLDNTNWIVTKERTLNLINLKPGTHHIWLQATTDEIHWGENCMLSFYAEYPFYKTAWFNAFIFMCMVITFFIAFQIRLNFINKKNQQNIARLKQLEDLRYQALNVSVNPHFIFNTLGSIQSYVTGKDPFVASDYIAKFAKLIRITLNHGGDKYITIEEEIKRLIAYFELEKLRCGDKLQYQISIGENVNVNTKIPNMIIQPLIENSIIHGVLKLENNITGIVKLTINYENNFMVIKVSDNGVGFNSTLDSKHGYTSIGLSNLKERLALIKNSEFTITNIQSDHKNETGTVAIIKFPP